MSYIQIHKRHILKNVIAIEKHNNLKILFLKKSSNIVQRKTVKNSMKEHLQTLDLFSKFIVNFEKNVKNSRKIKYENFIKQRKKVCENYLTSILNQNCNSFIPLIVFCVSLYNHYHTLKMFEIFVNKMK